MAVLKRSQKIKSSERFSYLRWTMTSGVKQNPPNMSLQGFRTFQQW